MGEMTRRQFVSASVAGVACSLTLGGRALAGSSGATSNPAGGAGGPGAEPRGFDAGEVASIKEGFTDTFAKSKYVMIVRTKDTIYALSAVCTHQGGWLKANGNGLKCLKHGGTFDATGRATHGPANGQLVRYGVALQDGHLWVDPNAIFFAGDVDKAGASVKLP